MIRHNEYRRKIKMELLIDGYVYGFNRLYPNELVNEISKYLTCYIWDENVSKISECDDKHFKSVVLWTVDKLVFRSYFDISKLSILLDQYEINGREFCEMGRINWKVMLKQNSIGNTGPIYRLWLMIQKFDFNSINCRLPIYIELL